MTVAPTADRQLTIPSSASLVFGESTIALHVAGITVRGALQAGAETCRLASELVITLHGTRPTGDLLTTMRRSSENTPWVKGVFVTGQLELHGRRYFPTWTRLAAPVQPGDRLIALQHAVDWQPGQTIVLVSTALKDARDWHQNEELVIETSLPPNGTQWAGTEVGAVLRLTAPCAYAHAANTAYQAEVGLLSRNIRIEGAADDSPPTDNSPVACTHSEWILGSNSVPCAHTFRTGYGGHVMAVGSATARIAGVEFVRMGQTNFLGRYPLHFHLMGEAAGRATMRDCTVHKSFYRCVSIHGTSHAVVSQNVAYDVTGSCYYLEDGVEEHNTLEHNLAALIHFLGSPPSDGSQFIPDVDQSDDLLNPADSTAAGFYVSNANNVLVGNAASGGFTGFAFPELPAPLMMHRTELKKPSSRPILTFTGNTAHSSGFWWPRAGTIYFGGKLWHPQDDSDVLRYDPGRQNPPRDTCSCDPHEAHCTWCDDCRCKQEYQVYHRLEETKVFLSRGVGLNHWGPRVEIIGYEAHDVGLAASILGYGYINRMLVRCRTGESLAMPCASCARQMGGDGFEWCTRPCLELLLNS